MIFAKRILAAIFLFIVFFQFAHAESQKSSIDADQLLLRVQLKENESIQKAVKITNSGLGDMDLKAAAVGLNSVIELGTSSIKLMGSSSGIINLKISSPQKGVFVGKLILSSGQEAKEIPIVIEIESKKVIADLSLNPNAADKIYAGSRFSADVILLNLVPGKNSSVVVRYEMRDFENRTLLEESENITFSDRASFVRDFSVPANIKPGSYVLIASAEYGESLGTTTYIFDVEGKSKPDFYASICRDNASCRIIPAIFLVVSLMALIAVAGASFRKRKINAKKMESIAAENSKIQKKLDSLVEAHESGFLTDESYDKSRKKLLGMIGKLNKK